MTNSIASSITSGIRKINRLFCTTRRNNVALFIGRIHKNLSAFWNVNNKDLLPHCMPPGRLPRLPFPYWAETNEALPYMRNIHLLPLLKNGFYKNVSTVIIVMPSILFLFSLLSLEYEILDVITYYLRFTDKYFF